MKSRSAFTLAEIVLVIGLTILMMGIGIGMIQTLLKYQRHTAASARYLISVSTLSAKFRDDVRLAIRAEETEIEAPIEPETRLPGVQLTQPDGTTVIYATDQQSVIRLVYVGNERKHLDEFEIPSATSAACTHNAPEHSITLSIQRKLGPSQVIRNRLKDKGTPTRELRIEAFYTPEEPATGEAS